MGQIIKSLVFVCHSVSLSVNTPTAAILIQFCTVIRGPKSKIEFVWDKKNLMTPSPIVPIFCPCNAFSMERFSYHSIRWL